MGVSPWMHRDFVSLLTEVEWELKESSSKTYISRWRVLETVSRAFQRPWLITGSIPKYICFFAQFCQDTHTVVEPFKIRKTFSACTRNNARHARPFSRGNIKQLFHGLTMPLGEEIHSHHLGLTNILTCSILMLSEIPQLQRNKKSGYFWVLAQKWRWLSELHHKR